MEVSIVRRSNNFSLIKNLKILWTRRELIITWAWYQIISQYSETKLGLLWIFIKPILLSGTYTLAFSLILDVKPPKGGVPFICFYLAGLTAWQLFNRSTSESTVMAVMQLNIMTQIRFPREIVIIVGYLVNFIDFIGGFAILFFVLLMFGFPPSWSYLYLPLPIIAISLFTLGCMFFLSSVGVFVRDLPNFINPILSLLLFLSGVIFSLENVPENLLVFFNLNPLLHYIEMFREIVIYGKPPDLLSISILLIIGIITAILGYIYFKSKEPIFSDFR